MHDWNSMKYFADTRQQKLLDEAVERRRANLARPARPARVPHARLGPALGGAWRRLREAGRQAPRGHGA